MRNSGNIGPSASKTTRGFAWSFIGQGGQSIMQLVVVALLARILSPEEFGLSTAALVTVNFLMVFAQLGIGPALVQCPTLDTVTIRAAATFSLVQGIVVSLILFLAAPAVANFFQMPESRPLIECAALIFSIRGLSIVEESILQRELNFRGLAIVDITSFVWGFAGISIISACLGLGAMSIVLGHIAQMLVRTMAIRIRLQKQCGYTLSLGPVRPLLYFSSGFSVAKICNYMATQCDNIVVGRELGPVALGLYSRAYQFSVAPAAIVGGVTDRVLFPMMSSMQADPAKVKKTYLMGIGIVAQVTLPLSILLLICAEDIVSIIFGKGWEAATVPVQVLVSGLLFRTSYKISDSLARAMGAVYRRAWRQAMYAFLVLVGSIVGGNYWGIAGVATAVLIAVGINFIAMLHLSMGLCRARLSEVISVHRGGLGCTLPVAIITSATTFLLRHWGWHPIVIVGSSAMLATLGLIGLCKIRPRWLLGEQGIAALGAFALSMPLRIRKFIYWVCASANNPLEKPC